MTTASYPSSQVNFGPDKVNSVDLIQAADPNTLRAEVVAIESSIGLSPSVSTSASSTSSWYNDGRDYSTLTGRLSNIEIGVVADTHTQYIRKTSDSGNIITAGSSTSVPLVIKGAASQSAALIQFKDSSGDVLSYIDADGNFNGSATSTTNAGYQDILMLMGS